MAAGTGEELQMVTTFFIRKFRLEIFNWHSVYCGNFPAGRVKIVLPFTFWPKFPELNMVNGKQLLSTRMNWRQLSCQGTWRNDMTSCRRKNLWSSRECSGCFYWLIKTGASKNLLCGLFLPERYSSHKFICLFTWCSTRVSLWLIPCFPELAWSAKQRNLSKDADTCKSEASEKSKPVRKRIIAARARFGCDF